MAAVHARLRMGCSSLNSHLCKMLHVIDNSDCACGALLESPSHYFLHCPFYNGPRQKLLNIIEWYTACNINVLLFGDKNLTLEENKIIFTAVHQYIRSINRFVKGGGDGR